MHKRSLKELKSIVQIEDHHVFEKCTARICERLIGAEFNVARAGFQYGSDAATNESSPRRLKIECKRYSDTTPLDDRNLQGEVDDAIRRDISLEAWVLIATRAVAQQTRDTLRDKSNSTGVPILVFDWADTADVLPRLAALFIWALDVVKDFYSISGLRLSKKIKKDAAEVVEKIRQDLNPWMIGFSNLKKCADAKLIDFFNDPKESKSVFGQNIAVNAAVTVQRENLIKKLENWWLSGSDIAVLHGGEGMGKTWLPFNGFKEI